MQATEEMQNGKFQEAKFWKAIDGKIQCKLCNRYCIIEEGKSGNCKVRKNISGKLVSLVYGKAVSLAIDPIEKKPFFHFKPGTNCLSFGTYGCNFHCKQCQNYEISQDFTEQAIKALPYTSPEQIVQSCLDQNLPGLAYTYTEPTIFAEYALDTMKLAKEKSLYNVWVSNGYTTKSALDEIIPYLDAINIDLKGNDKFYKDVCGNIKRERVLENIKYLHEKKVHVEVTNLIVPGFNDSEKDFQEISEFILSVDEEMPLHFSAFYPCYKLDYLPRTDPAKISQAKEIAEKAGVKHVYAGNLKGEENSYCKKCKNLLVKRTSFYSTEVVGLEGNKCSKCGEENNFIV